MVCGRRWTRLRALALGPKTVQLVSAQREMMAARAQACGTSLAPTAFVFPDAADGDKPWRPDAVTQYFGRLRGRAGVRSEVQFKHLRKFMETYGQDLGFSLAQVALRVDMIRLWLVGSIPADLRKPIETSPSPSRVGSRSLALFGASVLRQSKLQKPLCPGG